MTPRVSTFLRHFAMTAALVACFSVGQFGANFAPFTLEALEGHASISADKASYLVAIEFAALFISAGLFWISGKNWPVRICAVGGITVYVAGSLATIVSTDWALLAASRALCGVGAGLAMSVANAAAASRSDYDAAFSQSIAGSSLVAFALFSTVPFVLKTQGSVGFFLLFAGCGLLFLLPAMFLAQGRRDADEPVSGDISAIGDDHDPPRTFSYAIVFLVAGFLARLNDSLSWTFNIKFADKAHVDPGALGIFLGALTLGCALVPFFGLWISRKFGYALPVLAVLAVKTLATPALYLANGFVSYAIAQTALFVTFVLSMQLTAIALAARDPLGRLVVLGTLLLMLADAMGPALAGQAFLQHGLFGITTVAVAFSGLGTIVVMWFTLGTRKPVESK